MIGFVAALLSASLLQVGSPSAASPPPGEPPPQEGAPAGVLTRSPSLQQFIPAPFPPEAEAAGASGSVLLSIVIGEDGAVTAVKVLDPGPHPSFAPAAEAAVRQFRFLPAEIDGKPAPVEIEYRYDFVLKRAAPAAPAELPVLLSGRVIERGTRTPIAGAAIEAGGVTAETDAAGRFALRGLAPGEVTVRVVSPEHEPLTMQETIAADRVVEVEYRLTRRHYDPYEAVVRGERPRREVSVKALATEEVRTLPGTQGDVIKVVQNLPGVARSPFGVGLLVVRGSDPADSAVFFDGVPIPLVFHFGGITSVVSSDVIEGLDFYPGNFGARLGRATGGAVEIRSREPRDRFHGLAQVDVYDGRAQVEGPLGGGRLVLSVRRSWVDAVLRAALPKVAPDAADDLRIAPRYYDYQARYSRPLGRGTLSLMAFGADDKLEFVRTDDTPGRPSFFLGTLFHRGAARWRAAFGDVQSDLVVYGGRDSFDVLQGTAFGVLSEVWSLGVRETARWRLSDALTLEGGIDSALRRLEYSLYSARPGGSGGSVDALIGEKATGTWLAPGAWIEAEWQPRPDLRLVGGLRADYDSRLETARGWLDPRATLFWDPRPGTTLSAAAGLFGKAPEPGELTALFGNPALVPPRAAHYAIGLRQALPWGSSVEATGFYKSLWRLVTSVDRDAAGLDAPLLSSAGRGEAIGAELLLRKDLARGLFGWLSYTWSRALRRDDPSQPSWPRWHLFDLDQTHNLTLVVSYRLPGEWIVGTRVRAVSGNPYTPFIGHFNDTDTTRYQCVASPDVLSRRVGPFFQADARVDKRWVFARWMFSMYVDVQNATQHENAEFRVPSYDCTQQVSIPGLPVFPSLGLRAEW
ncbi:MAG TPA: TonB-dependent receptor [Anaeromyxobacteraceae bacterium]|nr:TonB-dependent receptor [Anaeromyxobacteraceae bacterium]